jgi:twitching motility protein PilT
MEIRDLLSKCIEKRASDLHLTEGEPPILRIDGKLCRTNLAVLQREELKKMIYSLMSNTQKALFEQNLELDFSLALPGMDRFRANLHIQKGSTEAAFRRVPLTVPSVE